jgi:hypothetical protein
VLEVASALNERLQEEALLPVEAQQFGMAFCEHIESLKSVYVDVSKIPSFPVIHAPIPLPSLSTSVVLLQL